MDTYQNVRNASEASWLDEEEFSQAQDHYQPEFTISDKDNSDSAANKEDANRIEKSGYLIFII